MQGEVHCNASDEAYLNGWMGGLKWYKEYLFSFLLGPFPFCIKKSLLGQHCQPSSPPTISTKRWATVESLRHRGYLLHPPPNPQPPTSKPLHSYWSYISAPSTTITTTTGAYLKYYPFQQWPKNLKKKNSNMTKHWIEFGGGYFVLAVELVSPHRRSCPP